MTETEIRLEYDKRQFEILKLRISVNVAAGNIRGAHNNMEQMESVNDAIDTLLREINAPPEQPRYREIPFGMKCKLDPSPTPRTQADEEYGNGAGR